MPISGWLMKSPRARTPVSERTNLLRRDSLLKPEALCFRPRGEVST